MSMWYLSSISLASSGISLMGLKISWSKKCRLFTFPYDPQKTRNAFSLLQASASIFPSINRFRFLRDILGMASLLTTTLVQKGFMEWAMLGVSSPPGGQKAQHLTLGNLSLSFRAIRAAAPAPRL